MFIYGHAPVDWNNEFSGLKSLEIKLKKMFSGYKSRNQCKKTGNETGQYREILTGVSDY